MRPSIGAIIYGMKALLFLGAIALLAATPLPAQRRSSTSSQADSAAVAETASRFHRALTAGDTALVRRLLAPDLMVLEAGEVETRKEYLANHLAADVEYAQAVSSRTTVRSYTRDGNSAWLVSTSTARGKFRGRDVNNTGAELMILSRTTGGGQIRSLHW